MTVEKRDLTTEDVYRGLLDAEREIEVQRILKTKIMSRCTHKNKAGVSMLRHRRAGDLYDHEYWSCDVCYGGQRHAPIKEEEPHAE